MSIFLFTGITNFNIVHAETSVNDVLDSLVDELEEKSKEELISSELEDLSEEDLHSLVNLLNKKSKLTEAELQIQKTANNLLNGVKDKEPNELKNDTDRLLEIFNNITTMNELEIRKKLKLFTFSEIDKLRNELKMKEEHTSQELYLLKYIEKEYFTMTGIILLTLGILIFSISLFEYLDKHLDGEETMFSKICMGFGFIIFVLSYFV